MAGYIGTLPVPQATQTREDFTATAGQTTFTTLGYTPGYLDVYLNGVRLQDSDVTATDGSTFQIAACAAGDAVSAIGWSTFDAMNVNYANIQGTVPGGPNVGTDSVIRYNANSIAEDITIPANSNGFSGGPITIESGYAVTISTGSTWTII
jgi:hypothetical protein